MAVGRRMTLTSRARRSSHGHPSHTGVQQRLFRRQVHLTVLRSRQEAAGLEEGMGRNLV